MPKPERFALIFTRHQHFRYLIFQWELCPKTGNNHFQGYCEFKSRMRLSAMKKIDRRIHWEIRKGTQIQAIDYCKKAASKVKGPWEYGSPAVGQGKRMDLEALYKDALDPKKTLRDVADAHPASYLKFYKAVEHVRSLKAKSPPKKIRRDLKVYLLEGPHGTGKTHWAYAKFPNLYAVPIGKDFWLDGYHGEDVVLLDDFNGQLRLIDLLRLIDIYCVQVPVKGSFVYLHCTKIIITTNYHFSQWYDYSNRAESLLALGSRITNHIMFTGKPARRTCPVPVNIEDYESSDEEEAAALVPVKPELIRQGAERPIILSSSEEESSDDSFILAENTQLELQGKHQEDDPTDDDSSDESMDDFFPTPKRRTPMARSAKHPSRGVKRKRGY